MSLNAHRETIGTNDSRVIVDHWDTPVKKKTKKWGGGLHYIGVLSDTGSESTFTTYPTSSQQHNNIRT
jgi:hypothetical protein